MRQISYTFTRPEELWPILDYLQFQDYFRNSSEIFVHIALGIQKFEYAERIIEILRAVEHPIKIFGFTTTMEICSGHQQSSSIVASFIFLEKSSVEIKVFDCEYISEKEAAKEASEWIDQFPDAVLAELVQNELNLTNAMDFRNNLKPANKDLKIVGCCASTTMDEHGKIFVFSDRTVVKGIMLAVFRGEDLHCTTAYTLGWTPAGRKHTVTKKLGKNWIYEIDGRPIKELYYKYFGIEDDEKFCSNVMEFPVIVNQNGVDVARCPIRDNKDGGLFFAADVKEGDRISFSVGNTSEILRQSNENAKKIILFEPQAMIMSICVNRQSYLDAEQQFEINFYKKAGIDISGCSAFGELYGTGELIYYFNSALVVMALREGPIKNYDKSRELVESDEMKWPDKTIPLFDRIARFMRVSTQEYMELQEKEHERELEQMVEIEKAANEAKSSFLSNMSHEIRTPINAVLGMNEMILRESKDKQILEYARNINNAGITLLGLINDILDFSKIEAGKMEIISAEYSVSSMLNDLIVMVNTKARDKGLNLTARVDEETPDILCGDEMRIRQVILNILNNAVKYTEKGNVTLTMDYKDLSEDEIELEFHVLDTGIGIKKEDIDKLFSPFQRIEENRNRTIEGTGLGMSITKKLLEMMGSQLEVSSEYGKGSDFGFRLRQQVIRRDPVGNFEEKARHNSAAQRAFRESFTAPDARVLVVDDTSMNITVFVNLLKRTEIQIDTAESGPEAIALSAMKRYDIIFMDQRMPKMSGTEAMKRIRSESRCRNNHGTPIIVLTANAVTGMKEQFLREGFDDYISKPVDPQMLEAMIQKYLPKELVKKIEVSYEEEEEVLIIPELPPEIQRIEDINVRSGLTYCGGEETYIRVLKEFAAGAQTNIENLERFIEEGDYRNYTIKVHALKSAARLAGAMKISSLAEQLEASGDSGDYENIQRQNPWLMKQYAAVAYRLRELFEEFANSDKRELIDMESLREAYEGISECMEAFDFDSADSILKSLKKYAIPDEEKERFSKLELLMASVERDGIIELLKQ
ncbi:Signal transduction histidine kinase [Lachnospiraceae bacterium KH1T2]|nr:Signal transduction histidine kinase [Lachnospiraceae bacterium KH1T2]